MRSAQVRLLILACGNTLRSDDGVGPWLAEWAAQHFAAQPEIRVISRQQWTPDLAEDIANADSVLFIDCSIESAPGSIHLRPVEPATPEKGLATHHSGAAELLALARDLYNSRHQESQLLTIGAGSIELGEVFSAPVRDALPSACALLEKAVARFLTGSQP
jgi:hydrogenase maturation protease